MTLEGNLDHRQMVTDPIRPGYRLNVSMPIDDIGATLGAAIFEVIVVDDNSPDGTSALVAHAAESLPWLRLITRTTDRGLIASIRAGIADLVRRRPSQVS